MRFPEQFRLQGSDGGAGAFRMQSGFGKNMVVFNMIASDDEGGWEHVSVVIANKNRTATWEEMCKVKDLFWDRGEEVVQYHPADYDYVNVHDNCLHLWKPIDGQLLKTDPIHGIIKERIKELQKQKRETSSWGLKEKLVFTIQEMKKLVTDEKQKPPSNG